jgi:hypothetical protein
MSEFHVGDRVRIDIPDETDPDHERYHGEHGQIVDILEDEAGMLTGDGRDSTSTEYSSAPVRRWIQTIPIYSFFDSASGNVPSGTVSNTTSYVSSKTSLKIATNPHYSRIH